MKGCPYQCAGPPAVVPCVDRVPAHIWESWGTQEPLLRGVVGDTNVTACDELALSDKLKCGEYQYKVLCEVCPVTCGCADPYHTIVGFFGTTSHGCPSTCIDERSAYRRMFDNLVPYNETHSRPCSDIEVDALISTDLENDEDL